MRYKIAPIEKSTTPLILKPIYCILRHFLIEFSDKNFIFSSTKIKLRSKCFINKFLVTKKNNKKDYHSLVHCRLLYNTCVRVHSEYVYLHLKRTKFNYKKMFSAKKQVYEVFNVAFAAGKVLYRKI